MDQRKRMVFVFCLAGLLGCLVFLWQRFYELSRSEEREFEIYDRHYVMITGREDSDFWDRVYESSQEEGKNRGVNVDRFGDSTGSIRQCFVGNNSYNLGQEYGRQILELLAEEEDDNPREEEPADVLVLVDETRMDTSQNLILLGIRETLEDAEKEIGKVSVETSPVDNSRSFSSEESIRDIFLNSERLPDILVCLSAVHTRCAYQAAVDYNKVGTVQILGYYDSDAILDAVAKKILYCTIAPDTEQMGRLCVQALDEYVETGYTNNYMAVDTRLIRAREAERLVGE